MMHIYTKTLLLISLILLSLNIVVSSWWLGTFGIMLLLVSGTSLVLRIERLGKDPWERLMMGFVAIFSVWTILLDGMYLLVGRLEVWMVVLVLWFTAGGLFLFGQGKRVYPNIQRRQPILFSLISCLASLLLLVLFILARTDIPLVSPWNLFGPEPFVLLFVAILTAILASKERTDDVPLFGWMLVTFSTLSVSAIVYAIGFGFDPFLHRAAEEALIETGVVEPVRLLYSGQYVLVASLQYLTAWPIKYIDIWIVPVLASVWLPIAASVGFEQGWGLSRQQARMWWIGILAIPFMLATFTVPFTVTYVLFLGVMVGYPFFVRAPWRIFVVSLLGLIASALFHPLLSVPLVILFLGERLRRGCTGAGNVLLIIVTTALIGMSVPVMLLLATQSYDGVSNLSALLTNLPSFLQLFASPYWDPYPFIPWVLDALYEFRYWFPMGACVGAMIAILFTSLRPYAVAHGVFVLGLLISIWGASTLFTFAGIIQHEQGEFALRLVQALYTFSLPVFVVMLARIPGVEWLRGVFLASIVVIAWYFSYPQYNLKYPFFSPSVSAADVAAVHRIDKESDGEPYLVLSNQIMSAAAIQEFGFVHTFPYEGQEILWYAVPTGGSLYALFLSTIYEGPSRERYAQMAQETGARRIYVAMPSYWEWTSALRAQLDEGADRVFTESGITVYEFNSFFYEDTIN